MLKPVSCIVAVFVLACTCFVLSTPGDLAAGQAAPRAGHGPAQRPTPAPALPSAAASPFGTFTRTAPAELVQVRKARMLKAGYFTPEEYFTMPLAELNSRAKNNDLFALLQLGERYYFEHADLQFEDGYDFEHDPGALGLSYYARAAGLGHGGVLPRLIRLESETGDPVTAYSWYLFAQKIAQPVEGDFDWRGLSAQDRSRALKLAERHLSELPLYR